MHLRRPGPVSDYTESPLPISKSHVGWRDSGGTSRRSVSPRTEPSLNPDVSPRPPKGTVIIIPLPTPTRPEVFQSSHGPVGGVGDGRCGVSQGCRRVFVNSQLLVRVSRGCRPRVRSLTTLLCHRVQEQETSHPSSPHSLHRTGDVQETLP